MKTKTNRKSKTSNTPIVAPEYVIALQEDAQATLRKCLEKIEAPEEIMHLLSGVADLGYYLAEYKEKPDYFGRDQFDIESLVIKTINAIAQAGGVFHGAYTYSFPRKDSMLAEVEPVEE